MATYYCDPDGDNGNPGTEAEPWQTVSFAAAAISAGDTVIYEDGTYDIGSTVNAWTSGTSGNYCVHQARNSRQAIWEQTSYGSNPVVLTGESYIKFDGIKMQQEVMTSIGKFVHLYNCDYITLDDCEVMHTSPHCVMMENGCTNITIQDCDLHADTATVGYGRNGIAIYGTTANTDILIDGCTIYDNPHTGISSTANCSGDDSYTIRNCTIYSNDSHGISMHRAHNILIYDNTIYDAGGQGPRDDDKNGVRLVEDASASVYRNTIRDCTGSGIMIESDIDNVYIWNNVIENCNDVGNDYGSIGILYRDTYDQGTIEIQNNIIYHTQAGRYCLMTESAAEGAIDTMDYNLWYDSTAEETMRRNGTTYGTFAAYQAAGFEPNSVISDNPDFTNQAGHDFTLQAGSPAIDAGVDVGLDYNGAAPDIGYWESGYVDVSDTALCYAVLMEAMSGAAPMAAYLQDIAGGGVLVINGAHLVMNGAYVVVG